MRQVPVFIVALALLGSACSDSGSGDTVTVYSGRSEELIAPLIERFEKQTGIDVAVRYAGSTELAATILEEGGGGPADVFFAQDPASLGTVALAGRFSELPEEILAAVPARFTDAAGRWVGVSGRARVVAYDTTVVSVDELPATEDGFTASDWRGRTALAPTNGSFLAFVAAKILLEGEAATLAWLTSMADNNAPTYAGNSAIVAAIDDGQVETGLVNHYYRYRLAAEEPDTVVENYFFPEATAGSLVMPAGAGILAGAPHRDAATTFVEYLLSPEAQEYFAAETYEYPLVPGVPVASGLPPLESIPTPAVDLSLLATELDTATDLVAEAGLL